MLTRYVIFPQRGLLATRLSERWGGSSQLTLTVGDHSWSAAPADFGLAFDAPAAATALGLRRVLWQIESAPWKLTGKETHLRAAHQHITFIADHARDDAMRRSFLSLPEVAAVMEGVSPSRP